MNPSMRFAPVSGGPSARLSFVVWYFAVSGGATLMSADARLRRILVRDDAGEGAVTVAAGALAAHATRAAPGRKRRDIVIEMVNGEPAAASRWAAAFTAAGFRASANSLRYYAAVS